MDWNRWFAEVGLTDATAWGTLIAALVALATALFSIAMQAWGRRVVRFWIRDPELTWRPANARGEGGEDAPRVRMEVANIGDVNAHGVTVLVKAKKMTWTPTTPARGGWRVPFKGTPIWQIGDSKQLTFLVPVESWNDTKLEIRWVVPPMWRPDFMKVRKQVVRISDLGDRPAQPE